MTDWKTEQLKVATGVTDGSRNADYERGFIDGMQEQMRRSVDKAVNAMTRTWVDLTDQELVALRERVQEYTPMDSIKYGEALQRAMAQALKDKNT